ncbi:MAG: hypothetical protein NTW87_32110 [Planctomycetota bacterium]|nr:hypothetical protein [Planctomycetota bacterium]
MRSAKLWACVVLVAGALGCGGALKRGAFSGPAKLDFTAARSSLDDADVEIKDVALVSADGSRRRPGAGALTCYVRAGGKEQKVATLAFG